MFGLTFEKLLIIGILAAIIIGPEKLPRYAAMLGDWVRQARRALDGAKVRVKDEMGPEYADLDWKKLNPRQYDPRQIIRNALAEDSETSPTVHPAGRTPEELGLDPAEHDPALMRASGLTVAEAAPVGVAGTSSMSDAALVPEPFPSESTGAGQKPTIRVPAAVPAGARDGASREPERESAHTAEASSRA